MTAPRTHAQRPGRMYLRIDHGGYVLIGKAEWVAAPTERDDDKGDGYR